jgi:uncharacterized protein
MTDPAEVQVSVRGEARRSVPPDSAVLAGSIATTRDSKTEAVQAAAAALESLTDDLAALGGVALGVETLRRPLTWSAQSAATYPERSDDRNIPTGRVTATVALQITVRAFEVLDRLGGSLSQHEGLSVHDVSWHVDWDNPGWREVRAAAIAAAVSKGRDYATALGGELSSVEHIADPGLIGGDGGSVSRGVGTSRAFGLSGNGRDGGDSPSLDPVPQELTALIEARFGTTGVSLSRGFGS